MVNQERFYAELGRKIHMARKKVDMTQDELAMKVGLSRTSITNIERGRQKILLHSILDFARALDLDYTDLMPERMQSQNPKRQLERLLRGASPDERNWAKSALKRAS